MVGNDSFPYQKMFGELSKILNAEISEISNIRPSYKLWSSTHIVNSNFMTFASFQLSCFMRSRQGVLSVLGLIFRRAWTKTTFDRMRKTRHCVVIKCLHGLIWNGIFRGGSLFSWNGNFFRLPQGVVDIPGTWQLFRFNGIIILCIVLEARFLLTCTIQLVNRDGKEPSMLGVRFCSVV